MSGFARLVGKDGFDYYVQELSIILGRSGQNHSKVVGIGTTKLISREHARIFYDFEVKKWKLGVLGKNGVHLWNNDEERQTFDAGSECELYGGVRIEVTDFWFYFYLPVNDLTPRSEHGNESVLSLYNKVCRLLFLERFLLYTDSY
jgi:hypothetical protein